MATYLDSNPWGNVAWNGDTYSTNDKERDTYFKSDGKGNHVLKDGYESRYLGSGDNVSNNGAISTYTNSFDDNHDDYDADSDRKNYGIYKLPEAPTPASSPAPAPTPAPTPAPVATAAPKPKAEPKKPVEYSPEIQQAKERVSSYEKAMLSGEMSNNIFNNSRDTYIKPSSSSKSMKQYDFSGDSFNAEIAGKSNKQAQAAQNQMQTYITKYS